MGFLQLADFSYGLEREWVQFNFLMHPPKTVCRDPMRSFLAAHAGQQGFVNVTTTYLLRIVSDGSKVHLEGYISASSNRVMQPPELGGAAKTKAGQTDGMIISCQQNTSRSNNNQ
ncbi:hypothetical protein CSKR_102548 [Clonorchis sinensis]|uniref:Uncharacterized protein n=1 Tax=Clonorchis sinensis TaxID=79923 RepID=A0A3R7FRH4_CLOSI|nr:hypothetical protein CSKR_102548 [Clonorchis sinensis]